MAKISTVLSSLYKTAFPVCDNRHISLNLDIIDPSLEATQSVAYLTATIGFPLEEAISRCKKGDSITLGSRLEDGELQVFIKDTGTSLSRTEKSFLSTPKTDVHSRYGYGTTITIML